MQAWTWLGQLLKLFDEKDIANGLLTNLIAMGFETLILVEVLEWRRRREENRRLRPSRERTRNLLRSRLIDAEDNLHQLAVAMAQLRLKHVDKDYHLPSPARIVTLLAATKTAYDELGRDFIDRLPLLDDPTREVFEAWFEQMEAFLGNWPIRRMLLPNFLSEWGQVADDEDWKLIKGLAAAEVVARQTALIAMSIAGSLLHAHDNPRDGDSGLLDEAHQLKSKTHVWHKQLPKAAEELTDAD